jgi:hypothetical protein
MEWRKVADSLFEVSSTGLIRRIGKEKCFKPGVDAGGYFILPVHYEDGSRKTKRLHRLVGGAFLPNPDNLPELDHINRDRKDNRIENLRWVSKNKNQWNKGVQESKTGFTGVRESDGRWRATLWAYGKYHHLGVFSTLEEAVAARAEGEARLRPE